MPLSRGWALVSLPIPAGAAEIDLAVNKAFPSQYDPADTRTLAIRLRRPRVHADPARHAHIVRQQDNAVRNTREMLAGHDEVDKVRAELSLAQAVGVSGVPFFVLAGKFAIPGAQPRDVMLQLIERARERLADA